VSKNSEATPDFATRLCEVATGKEILFLKHGRQLTPYGHAWSPDGRILAIATYRNALSADDLIVSDFTIGLWDTVAGKELRSLGGLKENVSSLIFSPDGKSIVAGFNNGTILVFDVSNTRPGTISPPNFGKEESEACWTDLAGDDASNAYRATWRLIDAGAQSTPHLRRQLQSVPVADAGKIQKWIADLNSDTFALRDAASKDLSKIGEQAQMPIQKALKDDLPLETRRRLTQVLETVTNNPGPETIRTGRAIMVLERIGSAEARSVLKSLAGGASAAHATEEAAAALKRLDRYAKQKSLQSD
jgi:dipeptidyl aminopeptidase/acylaminoacyl peptidase